MQDTSNGVNVIDKTGEVVSVPREQLQNALADGLQMASPQQVEQHFKEQDYGGTGQQLLTGAESAGRVVSGGLSTGAETALGVDPAGIQARQEINPVSNILGGVAGFASGVGAAGLAMKAGAVGAGALGLGAEGAGLASRIGATATKFAIENMMVQSGDEVSKMLVHDPNQSIQTAATDVGLAGVIGAGLGTGVGAVGELWKATGGKFLHSHLESIIKKTGGMEGTTPEQMVNMEGIAPEKVSNAIGALGVDIDPIVRAGLSSDLNDQQILKTLQESGDKYGLEAQKAVQDFKTKAGDAVIEGFGKTPEEVKDLRELSKYDSGENTIKATSNELDKKLGPIEDDFKKISGDFKQAELNRDIKGSIEDKLATLTQEKGLLKSPDSEQLKLVNKTLKDLPLQETAEDLRNYISNNLNKYSLDDGNLNYIRGAIKRILRDGEENAVRSAIGHDAPELLDLHDSARAKYYQAMRLIDNLNDRLHVGKYDGPRSFVKALNEMRPEQVIDRLASKNDAGLITEVLSQLPETLNAVKNYHLDQVLKPAVMGRGVDESINLKTLIRGIDKLSPELKAFALPPEGLAKLRAAETILDHLERLPQNNSKTSRYSTIAGKYAMPSAIGLATMVMGHNPAVGIVMGGLAKGLSQDLPNATRLGFLKFLGSTEPVSASGFKSMVEGIQKIYNGQNAVVNSIKNIFNAGAAVIPSKLIPTEKDKKKLDKIVTEYQQDPSKMLNVADGSSNYLPEHAQAVGTLTATAVNYLSSMKPQPTKAGPLDKEQPPNKVDEAKYDRALEIAQQPLMSLQKIKDNNLQPQDVLTVKTIYPDLYNKMSQEMTDQMINHVSKDKPIPYSMRMGMSLFLGQPLDASMTPMTMQGIQASLHAPVQAPQQEGQPKQHGSTKKLGDIARMNRTDSQAREATKFS